MDEVEYLTNPGTAVDIAALPNLSHDNIKLEVQNCLDALEKIGMEVFVINTMHAKLQVPTIYTIVPGAHFRERSRSKNAGLFAAKLLAELVDDPMTSNGHLQKIKNILPDSYYVEFYLGRNLLTMGGHDEALRHFQRALALRPEEEDVPYIYSYIGTCLKDLGRYEEAIAMLEEGRAVDNERPDLHNLLGFCHYKMGEFKTAINHFRKTVELNPSSAIDYANLGVNYHKLGQNDQAINYFELALSLDSSIDFARDHLSRLVAGQKG